MSRETSSTQSYLTFVALVCIQEPRQNPFVPCLSYPAAAALLQAVRDSSWYKEDQVECKPAQVYYDSLLYLTMAYYTLTHIRHTHTHTHTNKAKQRQCTTNFFYFALPLYLYNLLFINNSAKLIHLKVFQNPQKS